MGAIFRTIGGYISHGPDAGVFRYSVYASLPKSKSKTRRKSAEDVAAAYGLSPAEVGPIDGERFVAFLWQLAGRPADYRSDWQRACPLTIVMDNYSVHKSEPVKQARAALEAASVTLWYLPAYSPQLSDIEPIWQSVKHHEMQERSHAEIKTMKQAVEQALGRKAQRLLARHGKTTDLLCATA